MFLQQNDLAKRVTYIHINVDAISSYPAAPEGDIGYRLQYA